MRKKSLLSKLMLLLSIIFVGAGTTWASEASFAPSNFSGQGTSGTGSAISATVDGVTLACDKGYGTTQIRCYSGGKITITSSNTITAINFTFSGSYTGGLETSYTSLSTTSWEKTLSSQARITAVTVTYNTGGSQTQAVATPTFSPSAGAVAEGTVVTISSSTNGATIYYTTDNSTPSASNGIQGKTVTINSATTIKAIAVKEGMDDSEIAEASYTIKQVVKGYTIDFESDLDDYVDWTMTNAEQAANGANSNINAHEGTHYGTTGGKATASIQTKTKVALPGSFTCYVSKQSGNTTSSTWYVQVSSDGSTWTDVESKSATSMNAGTWEIFTANLSSYSDVYVRLYYSGSTAVRNVDDISITMRDPNAKVTPTVTINATALKNDLAGSTSVNAGTITATVTSGETTITDPAVTWSSDNTSVATVDASTGAVTLIAVGTANIIATFAGNDDYTDATASYELTVIDTYAKGQINNPYTVAEAIAAYDEAGSDVVDVYVTGIVSEIVTEYSSQYGNISYNISADGSTTGTQLEAFRGKSYDGAHFTSANDIKVGDNVVLFGTIILYNTTYELAADNQLVSLQRTKENPTIVVNESETVVYGSTFTVDDSMIEGGEITVTSSNTAVATVSGLVVTPVAVGTTTITVATDENAYYNAGSETFELTVTAPAGGTSAPVEGYVKVTNINDLTDGEYLIVYESGNVAFNGGLETLDAQGNYISVSISENTIASSATVDAATFTVATVEGGYSIKSASGSYIGRTAASNGFNSSATEVYTNTITFSNGNAVITSSGGPTLQFFASNGQERFRYYASTQKSISLYKKMETTLSVKLNGSGYATFCSQYPLDFKDAEGYSAWQITGVDDTKITFAKIEGSVKGGTGVLLKGEAGAAVNLTSVDSENTLDDNLLEGTLAPTYVATGDYYGLSGNQFVKVNAGTVPAGKALLDAVWVSNASGARLSFVFEDDNTTTAISEKGIVNSEKFATAPAYNLNGQRVNDMKKGGLYIMNGKKVIMK